MHRSASNGSATTDEGTPVAITLAATDIDTGDTLTYAVVTGPTNGTLSGTAPNLTYTPNGDYNGSDSFTFTANDGTENSNVATVSITVNEVGGIILLGGYDGTNAIGSPKQDAAAVGNVSLTASFTGTVVYNKFNPGNFYNGGALWGTTGFTTAADGSNTKNVLLVDVHPVTVSFVITNTGTEGILLDSLHWRAQRDRGTSPTEATITYTAGDLADTPGGSGIQIMGTTAKSSTGGYDFALSGILTDRTLAAGESATLTWITNDMDDRLRLDNFAISGSIVGAPVNSPPVASNGSETTDEDAAVAITLAATDADLDSLSYTVLSGPTNGSLSGTAPNLTYTPNGDYNGSDSFTFKANDGTEDSNIATVSLTVNALNDAPVAAAGSDSTNEDAAVAITLVATDIDSTIQSYTVVSGPTNGSLSGTAPNLTYTPTADYNGADSFTFRASDGSLNSNTTTVSLTVNAVNDAPVASNGSATTNEDTAVAVTLAATDIDSAIQSYTVVTRTDQRHPERHRSEPDLHAECQRQRRGQLHLHGK